MLAQRHGQTLAPAVPSLAECEMQGLRLRLQVTFILLGKYLEASAKGRTSEAIQALLTLGPPTALLLEGGEGEGEGTLGSDNPSPGKGSQDPAPATEREVPTALIHRGDRLKVRLKKEPGKDTVWQGIQLLQISA